MVKRVLIAILCIIVAASMIVPAVMSFAEPASNFSGNGNQEKQQGDPNKLTILFEHDIHSHLETFPQMATIIKKSKIEDPDTIVLDAGDFAMGTPYQTVFRNQAAELRMMGFLGFDATTLGNHEFDYRPIGLADMLNSAVARTAEDLKKAQDEVPVYKRSVNNSNSKERTPEEKYRLPQMINSNIDWSNTLKDKNLKANGETLKDALENYGSKEYTIIEKAGKKIAVLGIFGKQSLAYAPEAGTKFKDPIKSAAKIVEKIKREKPDFIVAISHSGTNDNKEKSEDELLAKAVPDIDLIVSGHSHTLLNRPIIIGKTTIASCGAYGAYMGKIKYGRESAGSSFKATSYNLIPLSSIVADEETSKELEKYRGIVDEEFFKPYGLKWSQELTKSNFDFEPIETLGKAQQELKLGNLLSDSFIYGIKEAESDNYEPISFSLINAGTIRGSFKAGPITAADAYNSLSIGSGPDGKPGYPLVTVYLNGSEIRALAEVDATVSEMMPEARLYVSGLMYRINPNRLFLNKISEIYKVNGDSTVNQSSLPYASGIGKDNNPSKVSDKQDLADIEKQVDDLKNSKAIEELDSDKLYRVAGDLYACQMLGTVTDMSKGLLSIVPKDKDGNEIRDFEKHIVKNQDGSELKEWYATVRYLSSFGDSGIPIGYNVLQGRKIVEDVSGISAYLKNPGRVFWLALGVVILAVTVLMLLIILLWKLISRIFGCNRKRRYNTSGIFGPSSSSVYRASSGGNTIFKHRRNRYKSRWRKK
ncbi:bifunctional metallophosphatase/5'-nucleotidase [Eubacteriales bacterium KG127]